MILTLPWHSITPEKRFPPPRARGRGFRRSIPGGEKRDRKHEEALSEKELDLALEMIKKWIEEEKKKEMQMAEEMLETIKKWMEEEMKKEK